MPVIPTGWRDRNVLHHPGLIYRQRISATGLPMDIVLPIYYFKCFFVKKYTNYFKSLAYDIPASTVVFLVALPLCLGIALGSDAPLLSGVIAGIVGGIVVGALSGSQLSVSGPAAGLTAIVAVAIGRLDTYEAFLLAVVLGGVLQLILGFIKAGVLGDYVPLSVITGMLTAIGLILIIKQMPYLAGINPDAGGFSFGSILPVALGIGLLAILIQAVWDTWLVRIHKVFKLIPAPLVVVVAAIAINEALKTVSPALALGSASLVNIPVADSVRDLGSFLTFPDFSFLLNSGIWVTAITLAVVASLETLLNVQAADELDPFQRFTPKNRELKAQGVGNIVSGLLGGLPVTSVIVRTSANVNAGARTKMSTIYHGGLLLLFVAFFPGLLNMIPLSALAGILIFTGYKLAKPSLFAKLYRKGLDQFAPFFITVVAILFTDLLVGILIGCIAGLFFVMRSNFKSAVFVVSDTNKYLFRLRKDVSFLNKPIIKSRLEEVPENSYVLIDASRADFIDRDIIDVIEDFMKHAHLKDIRVELKKSAHRNLGFKGENKTTPIPSIKIISYAHVRKTFVRK